MVDNIGATEWQPEREADMDHRSHNSTEVRQYDEADTDSPRHAYRIEQGLTNGCVTVICHCCQDEALSVSKTGEEKHLQCTATERDAIPGC